MNTILLWLGLWRFAGSPFFSTALGFECVGNMSCSLASPLPGISPEVGTDFWAEHLCPLLHWGELLCSWEQKISAKLGRWVFRCWNSGNLDFVSLKGHFRQCLLPCTRVWGHSHTAGRNDSEHTMMKLHITAALRVRMETGPSSPVTHLWSVSISRTLEALQCILSEAELSCLPLW